MLVPHALLPCIAAMRITGCIVRKLFQSPIHIRTSSNRTCSYSRVSGTIAHVCNFYTHQQRIEGGAKYSNPKNVTTRFHITSIFFMLLHDRRRVACSRHIKKYIIN